MCFTIRIFMSDTKKEDKYFLYALIGLSPLFFFWMTGDLYEFDLVLMFFALVLHWMNVGWIFAIAAGMTKAENPLVLGVLIIICYILGFIVTQGLLFDYGG